MAKTIAVINQKGGVAKTTTAAALLAGLTLRGKRVLAVDLDAQTSLSFILGVNTDGATSLDLLQKKGGKTAVEAIQSTKYGDVIPATPELSGADGNSSIVGIGQEFRLKKALETVISKYDYIILDTPPALGIITVNALVACDSVIIPAQADVLSIQAISQLAETISDVREINPNLAISGILLTRYNSRAVLSRDLAETAGEMASQLDTKVFRSQIREGIAIKEAQASQQSIFEYDSSAKAVEDYSSFIDELLEADNHG